MDKAQYIPIVISAFGAGYGLAVSNMPRPTTTEFSNAGAAAAFYAGFDTLPVSSIMQPFVVKAASDGFDAGFAKIENGKPDFPPSVVPTDALLATLQAVYDDALVQGRNGTGGGKVVDQNQPAPSSHTGWWIFGGLALVAVVTGVGYVMTGRKHNPSKGSAVAKHGGYVWATTYEKVTPESVEYGDAEDRGWEYEYEDHKPEKSLADLLNNIPSHSWLEWSDSRPTGRSWITSEHDQNRAYFEKGEQTSYDLHVKHADGTVLTKQELKFIDSALKLRGRFV